MPDSPDLAATIEEWSRALDLTAMPQARTAFLTFMYELGFTIEERVLDDGERHTIFRYLDDDNVPVLAGDWLAALAHVFIRRNWPHAGPPFLVATGHLPEPPYSDRVYWKPDGAV